MKKVCHLIILCCITLLCFVINVYANDITTEQLLSLSNEEITNINLIRFEKVGDYGFVNIEIKNKKEALDFYDEFKRLQAYKISEKEYSPNEYLYCYIGTSVEKDIYYHSDSGFSINSHDNEQKIEYRIDYYECLNLLSNLGYRWESGGSVGPEYPNNNIIPGEIFAEMEHTLEASRLHNKKIIHGDENGNLNLFDEITRAEFSVILCRIMGCESDVYISALKEKSYFSDVSSDHWGISYINLAYEKGAIRGFPDGSFKPDEPVTNEQAIKMLIAAWGYADEAEANGGYPNGYMKVAKEYGMLDSVSFNHKSPSKRWLSSVFVYNILSVTPKAEGVNPPMTTEIIKHDTIRDENYESYNVKPVEVLKFVTQESALYERTSIKQTVPEEYYPIEHLSCGIKNISDVEYLLLLKDEENTEVWHQQIIKPNEVLDLTTFNMGDYFIELHSKDGVIDDTYREKIYINKDEIVFTNLMNRTTIRNDF